MTYARLWQLTPTELDYLKLAVCGKTNREIAVLHNVCLGTVESLLGRARSKMGVNNRVEATLYALRHGIVTLDEACEAAGIGEGR